jgi:hypothetical protein
MAVKRVENDAIFCHNSLKQTAMGKNLQSIAALSMMTRPFSP